MKLTSQSSSNSPWKAATGAILAVLALTVAACGTNGDSGTDATPAGAETTAAEGEGDAQADAPEQYVFGAALPMTGAASQTGESMNQGIELAVEEINSDGGVNGVPLEYVLEDMMSTPDGGVNAARSLATNPDISVIFSALTTATLAEIPVAEDNDIVLVNGGGTGPELYEASDHLFNDVPLYTDQIAVAVDYAVANLNVETIGMYYRSDDFGQGAYEALQSLADPLGVDLVAAESYEPEQRDHRTAITQLSNAKPDAVYLTAFGDETGNILNQSQERGFEPQWVSSSGFENARALEIAGENMNGAVYTVPSRVGADGTKNEATKAFEDAFTEKFSEDTMTHVAYTYYDMTKMYAEILASLTQDDPTQPSGEELIEAYESYDSYSGVYGPVEFGADHVSTKPIAIKTVESGEYETVTIYSGEEVAGLRQGG